MDRKTGAIKKTIIRNCEVPLKVSEKRRNVVENFNALSLTEFNRQHGSRKDQPMLAKSTTSRLAKENLFEHGIKYKVPQVNTSEKIVDRIHKLETMKTRREIKPEEMTPRSKAIVSQEITKKLNFAPDQQIFKNLIPINVNDSLLIPPEQRKPFRKKYVPKKNKDPVPELADFLAPVPPLKYVIPFKETPPIRVKSDHNSYKSIYELYVNFHPDC